MLDGCGSVLLVKFHPMDVKNTVEWPSYRNIRIYTDSFFRAQGFNLYKLLACSDALVTDISSCAIDYLLLNRPVGFFAPDLHSYSRGIIPEVLQKLQTVVNHLRTVEEFGAFVRCLPVDTTISSERQDLHEMSLREPSRAILKAIGLSDLSA